MRKKRYYINGKKCSKGEKLVSEFLVENKISFIKEKTFNNCISPKNRLLRFDFFIPCKNLLIEFQGQHHYFPVNKGRRAKFVHNKTIIHDEIKRNFATKNNFKLIEINYKDINNINKILKDIL